MTNRTTYDPDDPDDTHPPEDWGLRGYEPEEPTDEERAIQALDDLAHVRDHHTIDDDVPPWQRRDNTPPVMATLDELQRQFGHDRDSVTVAERLEEIREDQGGRINQRKDVLARLDDVEAEADRLARPQQGGDYQRTVRTYPFGRSHGDSVDRIEDAVGTLRDLLTEDESVDGWGMAALEEAK